MLLAFYGHNACLSARKDGANLLSLRYQKNGPDYAQRRRTARKVPAKMSDNVRPIGKDILTYKGVPNPELVKVIEQVLAMAQSGQLQSFIGTGFTKDGLRLASWGDYHSDVYQMLGSIEWLSAEYKHRHINEMKLGE